MQELPNELAGKATSAQLWAWRMRRFTADDMALVLGRPVREMSSVMAALEAGGHVQQDAAMGTWRWREGAAPPPAQNAGRAPTVRELVARTLDRLEHLWRARGGDGVRYPGIRRYALLCLGGLRLPSGPLDRLTDLPRELATERFRLVFAGEPLPDAIRDAVRRRNLRMGPLRDIYAQRAKSLQSAWVAAAPAPDPFALLRQFPEESGNRPALPPDVAQLRSAGYHAALTARFGPVGQLLAGSKSRMPWSARCVFNARVTIGAPPGTSIWHGDAWLFPPPSAGHDPRAGALSLARAYGEPVALEYESGAPVWIMRPDGELEVPRPEPVRYLADQLEAGGWPDSGEWPDYPIEHRVGRRG